MELLALLTSSRDARDSALVLACVPCCWSPLRPVLLPEGVTLWSSHLPPRHHVMLLLQFDWVDNRRAPLGKEAGFFALFCFIIGLRLWAAPKPGWLSADTVLFCAVLEQVTSVLLYPFVHFLCFLGQEKSSKLVRWKTCLSCLELAELSYSVVAQLLRNEGGRQYGALLAGEAHSCTILEKAGDSLPHIWMFKIQSNSVSKVSVLSFLTVPVLAFASAFFHVKGKCTKNQKYFSISKAKQKPTFESSFLLNSYFLAVTKYCFFIVYKFN